MIAELPNHPIADIFPMMTEPELSSLTESIQRSGLRDPVVLLDGSVLDGRNRYAACLRINVTPSTREFGSLPSDGTCPARFVSDKNIEHRHLTTSQKVAAAEELVPYYQSETGMTTAEATNVVAAKFGVSPASVHSAKALKKVDGMGFDQVKKGEKTLNAAKKEVKAKLKPEPVDQSLKDLREATAKQFIKVTGEAFSHRIERGEVLKTEDELATFSTLDKEDQRMITHLLEDGMTCKKAMAFMLKELDGDNRIADLVRQARGLSKGTKAHKILIDGWVITCRKAAEGEAV